MSQIKTDPPVDYFAKANKKYLLILLGMILFIVWVMNTPPGLLGKTDAVGYAVCHRIGSHSFYFANRPFSLCARCTGQYLGFFWGFAFQFVLSRNRVGFPRLRYGLLSGVLFLAYLFDGVNSVFHLYPGFEQWSLYEPLNAVRLFTGLGMGLAISVFLYPLAGQTILKNYSLQPALRKSQDWLLFGGTVVLGLLILTDNPLVLYPIILLSSAGLILLLAVLYAVIWILITKKENSIDTPKGFFWWGLAGLISTLAQIMVVDGIRFFLTGTWSGFLDY